MKKALIGTLLGVSVGATTTTFVDVPIAHAIPVNCISCGSVALSTPTINGIVNFAVLRGFDFINEVNFHNIGFFGQVPGGSLDAIPDRVITVPRPNDFVYMYQLVNNGPNLINDYRIFGGKIAPQNLTGGGRLESTLFFHPGLGLVSPGPFGGTTALTNGMPQIDFVNGLADPVGQTWGPCLGSGGTANCSDATANLLTLTAQAINFGETPSQPLLDPNWTTSVMWFSTPKAPGTGLATIIAPDGSFVTGSITSTAVPEVATLFSAGFGLSVLGLMAFRRRN